MKRQLAKKTTSRKATKAINDFSTSLPRHAGAGRTSAAAVRSRAPAKRLKTVEVDPRFVPVMNAFGDDRSVTSGKLMASHGLRINGKIFAMFSRERFVVKLPKQIVDDLVSSRKGERFDPGHGRLMKEWVVVREGKADWVDLARQAYQFVKKGN